SGSSVAYATPTAHDAAGEPLPVTCSPVPGSPFGLGTSTVTCRATDSAGSTSTVSFSVSVVDTTPPALSVPEPLTIMTNDPHGLAATSAGVASFLAAAIARDSVDRAPAITNNAPAL